MFDGNLEPVLLVKVRELKNILIIMVVLSRVLLLALVFLVASATLVHAKGKKPAPEEEGDQGYQGDEGDELVAEKGGKKQLEVGEVTYDARSLMINGRRQLFFSGSIHYPRSTVEVSW